MTRIDGHNRPNRQNKKTTLADRRKAQNHKSLEVGQTITAPTGDPKLRERTTTIDFSQQQPVVTNPQVTTADAIAQLNQEQEAKTQAERLFKQERQLKIDQNKMQERIAKEEKDLASREQRLKNLDVKKHPKIAKRLQKQIEDGKKYIQDHKVQLGEIQQNLSNVQAEQAKLPLTARPLSKEAQSALNMARNAEQASRFQGTSQEAMNRLHGLNRGESDVTNQFREMEAKEIANKRQAYLDTAKEAEQASRFQGTSQEAMDRLHGLNRGESDVTKQFRELEKQSQHAAKIKSLKKAGKVGLGLALAAGAVYGLSKLFGGDDNKNAEVKQNNPVQEQKVTAPADTTATQKETPVAEEAKPEVKSETNTEAKPVVTPVPVAENDSIAKADATTEAEKADDAKAVVAKPETEETEEAEKTEKTEEAKEAEEAKKAEEELNEWIAQKGENYWKYAKQELIFEHQGQAGYKPTNKEINERMLKIMERNGVKFANDGIHSAPMLKIGDKVKVKFGTEEKAA